MCKLVTLGLAIATYFAAYAQLPSRLFACSGPRTNLLSDAVFMWPRDGAAIPANRYPFIVFREQPPPYPYFINIKPTDFALYAKTTTTETPVAANFITTYVDLIIDGSPVSDYPFSGGSAGVQRYFAVVVHPLQSLSAGVSYYVRYNFNYYGCLGGSASDPNPDCGASTEPIVVNREWSFIAGELKAASPEVPRSIDLRVTGEYTACSVFDCVMLTDCELQCRQRAVVVHRIQVQISDYKPIEDVRVLILSACRNPATNETGCHKKTALFIPQQPGNTEQYWLTFSVPNELEASSDCSLPVSAEIAVPEDDLPVITKNAFLPVNSVAFVPDQPCWDVDFYPKLGVGDGPPSVMPMNWPPCSSQIHGNEALSSDETGSDIGPEPVTTHDVGGGCTTAFNVNEGIVGYYWLVLLAVMVLLLVAYKAQCPKNPASKGE